MAKRVILGVYISNRVKNVLDVHKILTEHGCNIKTRLGLHEVGDKHCSPSGLLIVETCGKSNEILKMENKLKKVQGIQVQKMVFS